MIPFEIDSVLTQYIAISLKTVLYFSEVKLALDCDAKIHKDFSTNNKINNKKVKLRKSREKIRLLSLLTKANNEKNAFLTTKNSKRKLNRK